MDEDDPECRFCYEAMVLVDESGGRETWKCPSCDREYEGPEGGVKLPKQAKKVAAEMQKEHPGETMADILREPPSCDHAELQVAFGRSAIVCAACGQRWDWSGDRDRFVMEEGGDGG